MTISPSLESRIRQYVRRRFASLRREDREDAEQIALLKILQLSGKGINAGNPWPYLQATARNVVIEMLRDKCRIHEILVEEMAEGSDTTDLCEIVCRRDSLDKAISEIDTLHPEWIRAARLCAEGMTMDEIAQRTGVAPITARTRMHRVRALAATIGLSLIIAGAALGYMTASAPCYVATLAADNTQIGVAAPARAIASYGAEPLTVTCGTLYADLLPLGEVQLFGYVVGAGVGFVDITDGSTKSVRIYPTIPIRAVKNHYVRVRGICEHAGRLTISEYRVLGWRWHY